MQRDRGATVAASVNYVANPRFLRRSEKAATVKNHDHPEDMRDPIARGLAPPARLPMRAFRPAHRPSQAARRLGALSLAALCAAVAPGARAAAEDVNAPAPAEPDAASRFVAFGRHVLQTMRDSERIVVDAISANVAANTQAPAWHASLGTPLRSAALAARATTGADAAADPMQRSAGLADLSFGARWHVLQGDADSHVPCVSWLADVQPASGNSFLGGSALRPSMHLSAEWALTDDVSVGVMPGVAMDLDREGRRFANGTLAVTLGKEWTPGVRTFVDVARDRLTIEQGGGTSTTLDAGITVMTGASTQLDFALARGLTAAAPAFQAGVGVSSSF